MHLLYSVAKVKTTDYFLTMSTATPSKLVSSIIIKTQPTGFPTNNTDRSLSVPQSYPSFETKQLQLSDLALPNPAAYYLNPVGAPGCAAQHSPQDENLAVECNTIFRDLCVPNIAIPSQVASLQSLWSNCWATAGTAATRFTLTVATTSLVTPQMVGGVGGGPKPVAPSFVSKAKCALALKTPGFPRNRLKQRRDN